MAARGGHTLLPIPFEGEGEGDLSYVRHSWDATENPVSERK